MAGVGGCELADKCLGNLAEARGFCSMENGCGSEAHRGNVPGKCLERRRKVSHMSDGKPEVGIQDQVQERA